MNQQDIRLRADYASEVLSPLSDNIDVKNQEIDTAYDTGIAQGQAENQLFEDQLSKKQKKERMLEQTRRRKERDLIGKNTPATNDDDWWITEQAKRGLNMVLPHDMQVGIDKFGKTYSAENRIFNDDDMSNIWNEVQDDPYGDKVLYYTRVEDGYEDDGVTPKWLYKVGFADVSAYDRYKDQLPSQGIQVLGEKRFNSAEDVENRIHGNKTFLESQAFTRGAKTLDPNKVDSQHALNTFGSGSSELYNKDILGLGNQSQEQIDLNTQASKDAYMKAAMEYKPTKSMNWARAFGSGLTDLAGRAIKLVGPTELGQKISDNADKWTGYTHNDEKKAAQQIRRGFRRGNLFDIVDGIITGGPEIFIKSLPDMLAVAAATAATGGAAGVAEAASIGSKLSKVMPAITGMAAINTNNALDIRKQNNNGKEATAKEAMSVFVTEMLATGLDYGAFNIVTKGFGKGLGIKMPGGKIKPLNKVLEQIEPESRHKLLKSIIASTLKGGGKLAEGGAVESLQEVSTEAARLLTEEYKTSKQEGKSVEEVLTTPENKKRLSDSATLGFAGGGTPGGLHGIHTATKGISEALGDARDTRKRTNFADNLDSKEVADMVDYEMQVAIDNANLDDATYKEAQDFMNDIGSSKELKEKVGKLEEGDLKNVLNEAINSIASQYLKQNQDKNNKTISSNIETIFDENKKKVTETVELNLINTLNNMREVVSNENATEEQKKTYQTFLDAVYGIVKETADQEDLDNIFVKDKDGKVVDIEDGVLDIDFKNILNINKGNIQSLLTNETMTAIADGIRDGSISVNDSIKQGIVSSDMTEDQANSVLETGKQKLDVRRKANRVNAIENRRQQLEVERARREGRLDKEGKKKADTKELNKETEKRSKIPIYNFLKKIRTNREILDFLSKNHTLKELIDLKRNNTFTGVGPKQTTDMNSKVQKLLDRAIRDKQESKKMSKFSDATANEKIDTSVENQGRTIDSPVKKVLDKNAKGETTTRIEFTNAINSIIAALKYKKIGNTDNVIAIRNALHKLMIDGHISAKREMMLVKRLEKIGKGAVERGSEEDIERLKKDVQELEKGDDMELEGSGDIITKESDTKEPIKINHLVAETGNVYIIEEESKDVGSNGTFKISRDGEVLSEGYITIDEAIAQIEIYENIDNIVKEFDEEDFTEEILQDEWVLSDEEFDSLPKELKEKFEQSKENIICEG